MREYLRFYYNLFSDNISIILIGSLCLLKKLFDISFFPNDKYSTIDLLISLILYRILSLIDGCRYL